MSYREFISTNEFLWFNYLDSSYQFLIFFYCNENLFELEFDFFKTSAGKKDLLKAEKGLRTCLFTLTSKKFYILLVIKSELKLNSGISYSYL